MLHFQIDPHSGIPVYRQMMDQVKYYVASGVLKAGVSRGTRVSEFRDCKRTERSRMASSFLTDTNQKKLFHTCIVVCCLLFLSGCSKVPQISVSPSTVLLEPNEPGAEVTLQLSVTNNGQQPTSKIYFQPSCACAVIANVTEPVGPGETVTVDVPFNYPVREGKFAERIYIKAAFEGQPLKAKRDVIVTGISRATALLTPRSIISFVPKCVEYVSAHFVVQLLDDAVWRSARVQDIRMSAAENASTLVDIRLQMDASKRTILGIFRCPTSPLRVQDPFVGIIEIKAESSTKQYNMDLPFKIAFQDIIVSPDLIQFSRIEPSLIRIEMRHEVRLDRAEISSISQELRLRKEVFDFGPLGTTVLARVHPADNGLPADFLFGTVEFSFSNGATMRKAITVVANTEHKEERQ